MTEQGAERPREQGSGDGESEDGEVGEVGVSRVRSGGVPRVRGVRPRWWIPVLALALVAASGVVALNARSGEDCWTPPRATVRLADDPARATRTLDPGSSGGQDGKLSRLLAHGHWNTCEGPSGSRVLGRVLIAATTGKAADDTEGHALRHTEAMARVLHASVTRLGARGQEFPDAFRPYAARLLAAWPTSVNTGVTGYSEVAGASWDTGAREARARFSREDRSTLALDNVLTALAADPKSYATLYDALRAHTAVALDPVHEDEAVPRVREDSKAKGRAAREKRRSADARTAYARLEAGMEGVAVLTRARDTHLADGTIPDGPAFDAAVLRHSAGGYAATARRATTAHAPEGAAAVRTPTRSARAWAVEGSAAAGHGRKDAAAWFMDGPRQMRRTVTLWARERHVPRADADRLRGALDRGHQLTMSLRGGSEPGLGY